MFTNNLYTASMITYNIAKPWRDYFFYNVPLMIGIFISLAYNQIVFFWPNGTYHEHYVNLSHGGFIP